MTKKAVVKTAMTRDHHDMVMAASERLQVTFEQRQRANIEYIQAKNTLLDIASGAYKYRKEPPPTEMA